MMEIEATIILNMLLLPISEKCIVVIYVIFQIKCPTL